MFDFSLSKMGFILITVLATASSVVSCKMENPEVYEGTWVVTKATLPGTSAMSQAQADTWLGKSFSYDANHAQLAQESCPAPKYERETLEQSTFLSEYRVPLSALGFDADEVTRIQIACNGSDTQPGQTLLIQEGVETYLIWDGVFFTLEKSSDATSTVASL